MDRDVEFFHRDMLEEKYSKNFQKEWLIVYSNGDILEFDTEEAAEKQRVHRISIGLDPMTGE